MVEARAESVEPDPAWARVHLKRAAEFAEDAGRDCTNLATRQVLYYQACVSAMEAVVQAGGRTVKPGSGYHLALIAEAAQLIEPQQADLFERISDARGLRADVSYYAGTTSEVEVRTIREAADALLAEAGAYIEGRSAPGS